MAILKNIDLEDNVSTTGVSELNENFNTLNNEKIEIIENYDFVNDLEDTDILLMYRPTDWTTYKITVGDFKASIPSPWQGDYPLWVITAWYGVCPKYIDDENIAYIAGDWKLKKKGAKSVSDWFPIADDDGSYPYGAMAICPNRDEMVYKNTTSPNNGVIFKKSKTWIDNWVAITTAVAKEMCYSPNWQYIVYTNADDWHKLYRKDITIPWDDNWSAIISAPSNFPNYSPDWLSIIYRNSMDWQLYKKPANDTTNWVNILDYNVCFSNDFTSDGVYIIYSTQEGIWKKPANDETDWIEIYSEAVTDLEYSPDNTVITCVKDGKLFNYEDKPYIEPTDYPVGVASSSIVGNDWCVSVLTDENAGEHSNKLIYSNHNDFDKFYIKSPESMGDGEPLEGMTANCAGWSQVAYYDWFLYYANSSDSFYLYKKDLAMSWDWIKITNQSVWSLVINSTNWNIVFWKKDDPNFSLYKTTFLATAGDESVFIAVTGSYSRFNLTFEENTWFVYFSWITDNWIVRKDFNWTGIGEKITDIPPLLMCFNTDWSEMYYTASSVLRKRATSIAWVDNGVDIFDSPLNGSVSLIGMDGNSIIYKINSYVNSNSVFKKLSSNGKRGVFLGVFSNRYPFPPAIIKTSDSKAFLARENLNWRQFNILNKSYDEQIEYILWKVTNGLGNKIYDVAYCNNDTEILYITWSRLRKKNATDLWDWDFATTKVVRNSFYVDENNLFYINISDWDTIYKKATLNNSDDWIQFSDNAVNVLTKIRKGNNWTQDVMVYRVDNSLYYKNYDWTWTETLIINNNCYDFDVHWENIVFTDNTGDKRLYKIKIDWTWKEELSTLTQCTWGIKISPDWTKVAYTRKPWTSYYLMVKTFEDTTYGYDCGTTSANAFTFSTDSKLLFSGFDWTSSEKLTVIDTELSSKKYYQSDYNKMSSCQAVSSNGLAMLWRGSRYLGDDEDCIIQSMVGEYDQYVEKD